ncbi:MAG: glycosyltransferase, partial [Synergistaceae bacterium]|nr:glycosyltransferase [Synergistaceae bacterium]
MSKIVEHKTLTISGEENGSTVEKNLDIISEVKTSYPFEIKKHKKWDNPKVSVIVPVYKVEKYLTQCLNSIVNQTMEELEIIIVDEGEKDRCREIIDYFEAHDPRIVAPHQKNGGYGASCNLGFDLAHGEYIAIVESDDWIEPEMYEEMYAYAKALDADVVKTPYSEYFSNGFKRDCNYRKAVSDALPQNTCFSMKEYSKLLAVHASLWSGIYKTEYMKKNNIRFVKA